MTKSYQFCHARLNDTIFELSQFDTEKQKRASDIYLRTNGMEASLLCITYENMRKQETHVDFVIISRTLNDVERISSQIYR